jgi:hypothetical protein
MTAPASPALANFEKMLVAGRDGALLRYSLGNAGSSRLNPDRK